MRNTWPTSKLGQVAGVFPSGVDKHINPDQKPVQLCNYLDVYRNRRLKKPHEFSTGSATQSEIERFRIQQGDVIITKDSEEPNDIGVPCLIADDFQNTVCGYHLALIRPGEKLNPSFLSYLFQSEAARRYFLAKANGLTRFGLDSRAITSFPVPLPQPNEQASVAYVFDAVESAVESAAATIQKATMLRDGLIQQLLTGHSKSDVTPRHKNEFLSHPKAGLVPKGWNVSPLKKLAEIQRGRFSHRPRNEPRFFGGPYPFIQTADIVASRGYIRHHSQTLSEEGRRISRMFPKGTIMITIAANIGDTAIASYDVFATDSVIGITPNAGVNSEFLELCLRMRKPFLERMATESAQANINYGNLRPLLISHPKTEDEQKEVACPILDCERLIQAKEQKISALQRLKKSMMQNLLTGRIRLPVESTAKKGK
jgi:type I restriction enzyme S subunit